MAPSPILNIEPNPNALPSDVELDAIVLAFCPAPPSEV